MLIKFANTEVEVWKVKVGVVVMLNSCYYHVAGFCLNDWLQLSDAYGKAFNAPTSDLTWLEPF